MCRKSTWPFIRWMDNFSRPLAFFSMHNVGIDETQGLVCLCSSSGWITNNIRLDAALEWKYMCRFRSTLACKMKMVLRPLACLANQSRVTETCCRPATGPPCNCNMHASIYSTLGIVGVAMQDSTYYHFFFSCDYYILHIVVYN